MEFHPISEGWRLMQGEEFASLVESVRAHGVKVPLWKYQGKILDGRNRYRAAVEVGRTGELKWHEFAGTEGQARDLAELLNDERRAPRPTSERRAWVAKLREQGLSTRAIADAVGVDAKTVRNDLKAGGDTSPPDQPEGVAEEECEECGPEATEPGEDSPATSSPPPAPEPPKVTGRDGKKYAATRPQASGSAKKKPAGRAVPVPATTAAEWSEFFARLAAVQDFTESISSHKLPEEMPRWQLQQLLESTAKSILNAAARLRQSR